MYNKQYHDEIIKKSHERSEKYGIEKERLYSKKILSREAVADNLKSNSALMRVASPFMESLYDFLISSGFIIILTDKEGCILNVVGDKEIVQAAEDLNMVAGAYMDEDSIGTNAMGTAIKENSPIQISATEHFITAYHRWTCSAAPIHKPSGEIIGVLNLTGSSNLVHPHTLGLVVAAVKSIENQIKSEIAQNKLMEAWQYSNTIMNSIPTGIIAIDRKGIIKNVNDTGCSILKTVRKNIINTSIEDILPSWKQILTGLEEGKNIQDEEINFRLNGAKERYSISAQPIENNNKAIIGIVISFKELQKVINLVNRYAGMSARYSFEELKGKSEKIKEIIELGKRVANSPSTILIEGESGTGKEVLAQAIHNYSSRRDSGFVAINCGAISKNLIESELFGYDEGAFTGAKKGGHPGKFELANGGTLFLDEIGEMPLDMQVNLLRVLQEGCVTRVGGNKYIPVNVRIIAATNKDLKKEVERGNFRQDLYYRLSIIPMILPPLRERKEDIPELVNHFLEIKSLKLGKKAPELEQQLLETLIDYHWPGNIRELENYIEKLVNLEDRMVSGDFINSSYISEPIVPNIPKFDSESLDYNKGIFLRPLEEIERDAITVCLSRFGGNITQAAKVLGISRNTLYLKLKKYAIEFTM